MKETDGTEFTLDMRDTIDDAYTACYTAVSILNDLLHYESMDAGSLTLEKENKQLYLLFQDRLNSMFVLAKKNKIDIKVIDDAKCIKTSRFNSIDDNFLDPTKVIVDIDIYKVDQVVRNLISNAMKFTPQNGTITIRTSIQKKDADQYQNAIHILKDAQFIGYLRIEVIDTGVGISIENQKKVFGEFVQFNKNTTQKGGGSGLGLMISRNIIQMHGGVLNFFSQGEGFGTTFYFDLPIYGAYGFTSSVISRVSMSVLNKSNDSDSRQSFRELPGRSGMVDEISNAIKSTLALLEDPSFSQVVPETVINAENSDRTEC